MNSTNQQLSATSSFENDVPSVGDNHDESNITQNNSNNDIENIVGNEMHIECSTNSSCLGKDNDTTSDEQNSKTQIHHYQSNEGQRVELSEVQNHNGNADIEIRNDKASEERVSKSLEASSHDLHKYTANSETGPRPPQEAFSLIQSNDHGNESYSQPDDDDYHDKMNDKLQEMSARKSDTRPRAPQAALSIIQSNDHGSESYSQSDDGDDKKQEMSVTNSVTRPRAPQAALNIIQSNDHGNEGDIQPDLERFDDEMSDDPIMAVPVEDTVVIATTLDMPVENEKENKQEGNGRRTKITLLTIICVLLLIIALLLLYLYRVKGKESPKKNSNNEERFNIFSDEEKEKISNKLEKSSKSRKLGPKYHAMLRNTVNIDEILN